MLRRISILLLVVLCALCASAQYDVSLSHYFDLEPTFNAGSVGKDSKLNINGVYAMDLAGFKRNPNTMLLTADMPFLFLNGLHGVGGMFMNDKLGLFSHQRITVQYAYKHKLFGGMLSVGLNAGLLNESFDGSKLDLEDSADPAFVSSEVNGNGLDLGAGIYYKRKNWYVGLSATHFNSPLIRLGDTNELQIDPTYYLTGGYNIKTRSPFLNIKTSVLLRTDATAYRGDVTARLCYKYENRDMYAGVSYSPGNSVTVLIGGQVHGINLGYSYEMYTSAINPYNGSHELFVGYQMDLNLIKKGKNKHKSVRIL